MKIAVCFSGQIRTGVYAIPSILNYLGDLRQYCTFFCHTWDVNTRKPFNADHNFRPDYIPDQETIDKFVNAYGLYGFHFKMENYDSIKATKHNKLWTPMHYSWRKSVEMFQEYVSTTNEKFDLVLKLRPDVLPRPTRSLAMEIANSFLNNDRNTFFTESTRIGQNGVMDDVIYIAIPEIMDQASKFAYAHEEQNIIGLGTYLKQLNINIASFSEGLAQGYTILREESIHRNPVADWDGCFEDDANLYKPK